MPEARRLFNQGIEAADRAADLSLYANGWNRLGEEYLKRGELALRGAASAGGLPRAQAEPPGARCLVPQPGTFAVGAGRSDLRRRAARSRSGTIRAAAGLDSDVGHLSLPRARSHGAGPVARSHGRSADRGSPGARLALERAARRCLPHGNGGLAGTGSFRPRGGRQPPVSGNRGSGANRRDLRGGRGESRQQSARRAFRADAHPIPPACRPAYWETLARLQRAEVQALRTQDAAEPGHRRQCPRRTGADGSSAGAGRSAFADLPAGTHSPGPGWRQRAAQLSVGRPHLVVMGPGPPGSRALRTACARRDRVAGASRGTGDPRGFVAGAAMRRRSSGEPSSAGWRRAFTTRRDGWWR